MVVSKFYMWCSNYELEPKDSRAEWAQKLQPKPNDSNWMNSFPYMTRLKESAIKSVIDFSLSIPRGRVLLYSVSSSPWTPLFMMCVYL